MNLDEFKQHVEAQRLSSLGIALEALTKSKALQEMSVLSATIPTTTRKENSNG
jgi:hypothetical protein